MLPNIQRSAVIFLLIIIASFFQTFAKYNTYRMPFKNAKLLHKASHMTRSDINALAYLTNIHHINNVLKNICIVRVVGTPGHLKVKKYIKSTLKSLNWSVESDIFEDRTPVFGKLKFENIIARFNPKAKRFLVLACHYDSKYEKKFKFVGATDSAVPCTQLINLAKVMQNQLNTIKNADLSLMLLFLDGEEAFKSWSATDSLYGARHLANKWKKNTETYAGESISDLDKIDLFVLLDLIGAPNPIFYNYFKNTARWFALLSSTEERLAKASHFENYDYKNPNRKYFQNYTIHPDIQDDHIPFLEKNVSVLHLIPYPFPDIWHSAEDNRDALSISTIENINKILRVFVASYLNINV
ncbi:PREDICTED: glutaminyl-peptide cyclotransferase [Ceratosolen solmsi marchali]|uniref:Glutaminyl-peptide cyclotransferase n=1 Tax=Ceratosolen solmsi marchali TaxID=326594 RepID=A0AAJ6VIR0_9HYME|nr:PREDICTED: glutaminyl-peptide cyclotransferase [Ceratosolen solmsi marchali]